MAVKSRKVVFITPPESICHVRHVVLIVAPSIIAVDHTDFIEVGSTSNITSSVVGDNNVVVDAVISGEVWPISTGTAILLNEADAIASCHVNLIAIHLDVVGILDLNLITPHPAALVSRVVHNNIVADDRVVTDFMRYPDAGVIDYDIVFIKRVDVVDVGPHTVAIVIVRVVAAHDQTIGLWRI